MELIALAPAPKVAHDVRVVALAQHLDLHHEVLERLVLLQLHNLHGNDLSRRQVAPLVHCAKRALGNHLIQAVDLIWILAL